MTGIYGNCAEDKAREKELNAHLEAAYGASDRLEQAVESRQETTYETQQEFDEFLNGYEAWMLVAPELLTIVNTINKAKFGNEESIKKLMTACKEIRAKFDSRIEEIVEAEQ